MCAMKKPVLFLPFLLLTALTSCGNNGTPTAVKLDFGTKIGLDAEIEGRSHLNFIERSKLNSLVGTKSNFILLVHGAADTCTCYTDFHDKVLAPYAKHHKAMIYAIELEKFESETETFGVTRKVGVETLAIFKDGALAYQKTNEDGADKWGYDYATFNNWMKDRAADAKIYYVDEEILDSYYEGTVPFTVYFSLENCPDCNFLSNNALRAYLQSHDVVEENFFYFDMKPYWDYPDYVVRAEKMAKYGLSSFEGNEIGLDRGYVPTIYYVNPDGLHYYGDVIEAAGVFYNEKISDEGIVSHSYFTAERLEAGKDTYLSYLASSKLETKVIEGRNVGKVAKGSDWHTYISAYEDPIVNALLDYAVGA